MLEEKYDNLMNELQAQNETINEFAETRKHLNSARGAYQTRLLDYEQKPWLFKHALNITITGSYFETLDYLKSLESLAWHINWNSIDYQVDDYPLAITTFQIYTLSFEEQWLGL